MESRISASLLDSIKTSPDFAFTPSKQSESRYSDSLPEFVQYFLSVAGSPDPSFLSVPLVEEVQTEAEAFIDIVKGASLMRDYVSRGEAIKRFGWAVPTKDAITKLAKYGPIVEIGAGLGYWSYLLRRAGADVVATDQFAPIESEYQWGRAHGGEGKSWIDIEVMSATKAVMEYRNRTLMVVWPCYDKPWAADALARYTGGTFIYVGEGPYGCTGDDRFHRMLDRHWDKVEDIDIPQWFGMRDWVQVYRRNRRIKRGQKK